MVVVPTDGTMLCCNASELMDDKDALARLIKDCRTRFAVIFFVSEAWLRSVGTEEDAASGPPPSEHPDRIEAVVVTHYSGLEVSLAFARINRPAGRPPFLSEWDFCGDRIEGRLNLPLQHPN